MPERLQRQRTKGWRMPPDTVYVGRPTKWGNPYSVGRNVRTPNAAVDLYETPFGGAICPQQGCLPLGSVDISLLRVIPGK